MADTAALPRSPASTQGDVWSALCAAQAEFCAIGKTAKGARSKYAPLDEVLDALRPALTKNGLTSTALTFVDGEMMFVRRILTHAASETHMECVYPVAPVSRAPQDIGSALTYARRYSLLAICDVHPTDEDDDGERAGKAPPAATKSAHALRKEQVWPPIIKALHLVETKAEFEAWEDAHADTINSFPQSWRDELNEEIEKHREHIAEQKRLAREARAHV